MSLAGFSIEGDRLRAAVTKAGVPGTAPKKVHSAEYPLPSGREARVEALKSAAQELKSKHGVKAAIAGFSLSKFSHHLIEMPSMRKPDLRNAVRFELEKYLPLLPDEYSFDFVQKPEAEKKSRLFVLAARTEALSWVDEALTGAGVRPLGIRCTEMELLNRFIAGYRKVPGSFVFVHAAGGEARIILVKDGLPEAVRVVSAASAQKELERLGTGEARVFTSGDNCFNAALCHKNIPLDPALAVAASRGKRLYGMDFSRQGTAAYGLDRFYTKILWGMAAASLLVFFLTPVLGYYREYSADREIKKEIDALKSTARELIDIRRELEQIKQRKDFLLEYQGQMNVPVRSVSSLSGILPKDAWLSGFSMDEKGKIEIKGFASNSALLISPLEKSPVFRNVEFSNPVVARDGMERFSIKMELER